ncbi:hypothetical protein HJG60_011654 [Phyllostomus discolor]|uniref:Uncharacterized protein n=1 Tax=Phyllostomus discolor TaxID=89673 RepID=A0A833ZVS6_9CHIR|nr:hypothetical protein HJG60_011654 [Phyllostomus discolor]
MPGLKARARRSARPARRPPGPLWLEPWPHTPGRALLRPSSPAALRAVRPPPPPELPESPGPRPGGRPQDTPKPRSWGSSWLSASHRCPGPDHTVPHAPAPAPRCRRAWPVWGAALPARWGLPDSPSTSAGDRRLLHSVPLPAPQILFLHTSHSPSSQAAGGPGSPAPTDPA